MLEVISNQEEKRVSEFRTQYANKWFRYVVTSQKDEDNPISRVIHIADSKKELLTASREFLGTELTVFGIGWGVNVNPEPGLQIGLEIEWF